MSPTGSHSRTLGPKLVVLIGEVTESLGGGGCTSLGVDSGVYSLTPFTIPSPFFLYVDKTWSASSCSYVHAMPSQPQRTLHLPPTKGQKKLFFKLLSVMKFCHSNKK